MRRINIVLCGALALLLSSSAVAAQETFTGPGDEFSLELPNSTWRVTIRPDAAHQHAEFVYGDRNDGYLRLRKEMVDAGQTASDLADRDLDVKLRYLPGFAAGKEERFAGRLNGVVVNYDFTQGGKPMLGRIYYLQADPRTVYVLHFTGYRDRLLRIQNQTDVMARSFSLK